MAKNLIRVAHNNILTVRKNEKIPEPKTHEKWEKHGEIRDAVSQIVEIKIPMERNVQMWNYDLVLGSQCHNFGGTNNPSTFGTQCHVVGMFMVRILLRSNRLGRSYK